MLIGYARVSKSDEQNTAAQVIELKKAGCERIFQEEMSGAKHKPELEKALGQLRKGDILIVWKLDRLSRSLKDLLFTFEKIATAQAEFRSLTEAVDTTQPAGRMLMQMLGSFAEFERSMIRERTSMGLAAARAEGRIGGRPLRFDANQRRRAVQMINSGEQTQSDVARLFNVNRSMISRIMSEARMEAAGV